MTRRAARSARQDLCTGPRRRPRCASGPPSAQLPPQMSASYPCLVSTSSRVADDVRRLFARMSVVRCIRVSGYGVLLSGPEFVPAAMVKSVSIEHAALLLQKSRRTIYSRIHDRKLETIRVGVSQRVTLESLYRQPEFVQHQRLAEYLRAHAAAGSSRPDEGNPS